VCVTCVLRKLHVIIMQPSAVLSALRVHLHACLAVVAMTLEKYSSDSKPSLWKHAEAFTD